MNREKPNDFEEKYSNLLDETIEKSTQEIIDETDISAERMVNMTKILEKGSAGDQDTIDKLILHLQDEKPYSQDIKDVFMFMTDKLGPTRLSKDISPQEMIKLCQDAFEEMVNEKERLTYFRDK